MPFNMQDAGDKWGKWVIQAKFNKSCASGFSRSSILSRSLLLLSLSSMASLLTSFAIILPRVHRWTNALFIKYPVYRSHSAYNVTLRRIQNLNGFFYRIFLFTLRVQRDAPTHTKLKMAFSIGFFCSHSAHNVTLRRIQNLDGFSIGFCCSHSAHNVTLRRIQNLNGFSIGFFCSHSAHSMTLRLIQRLPTSVGLAQARPN